MRWSPIPPCLEQTKGREVTTATCVTREGREMASVVLGSENGTRFSTCSSISFLRPRGDSCVKYAERRDKCFEWMFKGKERKE